MNKNKIRKYAKKLKSINYLGGKCEKCDEENLFKLTFHHLNPLEKEFKISDSIDIRWSKLKVELDKCILLCQNCHREMHYDLDKKDDRRIDKKIYLEYAGSRCVECGYDKCTSSLTFHHKDPKEKEFSIGCLGERIKTIEDLEERIKNEIDKCNLLCSNCHVLKHSDVLFFEKNRTCIEEKTNHSEKQSKIDRDKVLEMFNNGYKQVDIAKHFSASKGTISDILKKYK